MPIPLERESKMWGLLYASDFNKLMFVFVGNALAFIAVFLLLGLEGALVLFFAVSILSTVYFIMRSFWPEQYLENQVRFYNEPRAYYPGREEDEL